MNQTKITVISLLTILALFGIYFVSAGNQLVALDEQVHMAASQVSNVYQRRLDLIPNLVNTVKGYAKHEKDTLESITQARASVGQINIDGLKSASDFKKFEASQGAITQALSKLMVISERYPELKANQNFLELQSQLEGTENRITIERQRFNDVTRVYNTTVRKFPSSIVASMKGMLAKPYFEAQAGAEIAPKVEF